MRFREAKAIDRIEAIFVFEARLISQLHRALASTFPSRDEVRKRQNEIDDGFVWRLKGVRFN